MKKTKDSKIFFVVIIIIIFIVGCLLKDPTFSNKFNNFRKIVIVNDENGHPKRVSEEELRRDIEQVEKDILEAENKGK